MPFPLDVKSLQATEEKLGLTFPSTFRGKMLRDNGGSVCAWGETWWLHPFLDNSDRKRIARTCNDIVRETAAARKSNAFPETAVAIGHNGGGDHLILIPKQDTLGELAQAVYWWDHETGDVAKLADDFADLLGSGHGV